MLFSSLGASAKFFSTAVVQLGFSRKKQLLPAWRPVLPGGTEQLCSYTGVFTGTSPQQSTNFNAPFSVCRAAMLYVFRTLVRREPILLDEGCPRPSCAPNTRRPSRRAISKPPSASLFGNQRYQHFDPIRSGARAPDSMAPAPCTPIDPLPPHRPRDIRAALPGPAGALRHPPGQWRKRALPGQGGGCARCIRFLEPMSVAVLANHRRVPPSGMAGGESGKTGRN